MAKLSAHGTEIFRGLDMVRGALVAIMSDGVVLQKRVGEGWKVRSRLKSGVDPVYAASRFRENRRIDPSIKRLPSERDLDRLKSLLGDYGKPWLPFPARPAKSDCF
jgi:hypothetical protein